MEPIGTRYVHGEEGLFDSITGKPYMPNEKSAIHFSNTPPSPEETEIRKQRLNTVVESIQLLDSGIRSPEWQMGYISPPGIRAQIPASTQKIASEARRGIYGLLKQNVQKDLQVANAYKNSTNPVVNKIVAEIPKQIAQEYKEQIKRVTAIPDSIISRVRTTGKLPSNYDSRATWSDYVAKRNKDMGGILRIHPATSSADLLQALPHELGGHSGINLTGILSKFMDPQKAKSIPLPSALKQEVQALVKKLPTKSKETINKLGKIAEFEEKWYYRSGTNQYYEKFYDQWPSELVSGFAENAIPLKAKNLGRRLTTDEYFATLEPVVDAVIKHANKLEKHFKQNPLK